MPRKDQTPTFRDRIQEFRRIPVADLQDHAGNWRRHPQQQKDALSGLLKDVGIAGALIAYHSARQGGALTLIDGHLRRGMGGDWPVLILDVTDAEADLLLASIDPIGSLAQADAVALDALLRDVSTGEAAVQQMLAELAEREGVVPPDGAGQAPVEAVEPQVDAPKSASLAERFIVPPFSVLDARQGYWQTRKRAWLALGIQSELGRGGATEHGAAVPGEGGATALYRQGASFSYSKDTRGQRGGKP